MNDRPIDDPSTAQAMDEIRAIYARYDLAGAFAVVNAGEWAYGYELPATWNAVIDDDTLPLGFRIRLKTAELGQERAQEFGLGTAHLFCSLVDFGTQTRTWFRDLLQILRQSGMRITHTPFGGRPLPRLGRQ